MKIVPAWLAIGFSAAILNSGQASAEAWRTQGICTFNGVPMRCVVRASADLLANAWSATYIIEWADGIQQRIVVGSDIRASVWVNGKETKAWQQDAASNGHCVIRTVTGNVTTFDSGRSRVDGSQFSC